MQWIRIAALLGGLSVVIGAFGAHGLKDRLAETGYASQFETGVQYHAIHALALLAVGILALMKGDEMRGLGLAGWSFIVGTLLFSGSLYALAVTGVTKLGAITPLGGLAFILGWGALFWGALKR